MIIMNRGEGFRLCLVFVALSMVEHTNLSRHPVSFTESDLPEDLETEYLEPVSWEWLSEHFDFIISKGFANGEKNKKGVFCFSGLTPKGQEFIDNARNSVVFSAARYAAEDLSFDVFCETLNLAAKKFAFSRLKEKLGF